MKLRAKGVLLALLAALALSACGGSGGSGGSGESSGGEAEPPPEEEEVVQESPVEKLVHANTLEALLRSHKNVLTQNALYAENHEDYMEQLAGPDYYYVAYLTEEDAAAEPGTYAAYLSTGEKDAYYASTEEGMQLCLTFYAMPEGEYHRIQPREIQPVLDETNTLRETVRDVAEQEDGSLLITAEMDNETLIRSVGALPPDWEGASYTARYTVDADTWELLSTREFIVLSDGTEILVAAEDIQLDVEEPAWAAEMLALMEAEEEPEQTRTITVVYNPGTEKEEQYSMTVDQRFLVFPLTREGYELFEDPEGTEYFSGVDTFASRTLYALPILEEEHTHEG